LETVLVLVQDRCMVCSKHAIASEIVSDDLVSIRLETVLMSVRLEIALISILDRCTVCA
jgi:uncharacterized protein with PIN domain